MELKDDTYHVSYSEIRDFAACEKLHAFKYTETRRVEGDPKRAFIGNVLQKVVEEFYVEEWWRVPTTLLLRMQTRADALCQIVTDAYAIRWEEGELAKWRHRMQEALPLIVATIKREKLLTREVRTECELTLNYGLLAPDGKPVQVHCRPDFIFATRPTFMVLDGKAGGTLGRFAPSNQIRIYALAVQRDPRFGVLPTRAGFWWYRHDMIRWVKLTPKGMLKFETGLKDTIRRMFFTLGSATTGRQCATCDFRLDCDQGKAYGMTRTGKVALAIEENSGVIGF